MPTTTFTDTTIYEPVVDPEKGGTSLGNSYLSTWSRCPRKWYNTYARKVESSTYEGVGIEEFTIGLPLLTGTLFHEALDRYYRSGIQGGEDTGNYDLSTAMNAIQNQWDSQRKKYASATQADEDKTRVEDMIRQYHDLKGPGSSQCDYPELKIAVDGDGQALIEQDYRYELKPGYWYTGRLDGMCWYEGELMVLEHKTVSAYGMKQRLNSLDTDPQFTGEIWLAQQAIKSAEVKGVLVNIVLKDRSHSSKYPLVTREVVRRNDKEIEAWRLGAVNVIDQINSAMRSHASDTIMVPDWQAEAINFPLEGQRNGGCHAYGRDCEFLPLCSMPGLEGRLMKQYNMKNRKVKGS